MIPKSRLCPGILLSIITVITASFIAMGFRGDVVVAAVLHNMGFVSFVKEYHGASTRSLVQSRELFQRSLTFDHLNWQAWLALGHVSLLEGHQQDAETELQQAVALEPQATLAHFLLGEIAEQRGDVVTAISEWARVGASRHLEQLYRVLWAEGRREEALSALQAAVEANPENATVRRLLGVTIYEVTGDGERAINALEFALYLDDSDLRNWDSLLEILRQTGQYERSLTWVERWIMRHPNRPEPFAWKAYLYVAQGQVQEAILLYQGVIQRFPEYAHCYYRLGQAYLAAGMPVEAISAYEAAIELAPAMNWYHEHLAGALIQAGDVERAKDELLFVLTYDPGNAWAQNMLEKLSER